MRTTINHAPALAGAIPGISGLPFVYLDANAVGMAVGKHPKTVFRLIAAGEFPAGDLIAPNSRRWRSDVIAQWLLDTAARCATDREQLQQATRMRSRLGVEAKRAKALEAEQQAARKPKRAAKIAQVEQVPA